MNASLQQVKVMAESRSSNDDTALDWLEDLNLIVSDCSGTFTDIESMIKASELKPKYLKKGKYYQMH